MPMPVSSRAALAATIAVSMSCGAPKTRPEPATGVTSEDLRDANQPVESVLQKRYPGLEVRKGPDGSLTVQVRGTGLGDATSPPMYVLNGSPYHPGPGGALTGIDPNDIDTIKLLRGADAAIYGINGANGVIVITTKRGKPKQ
jgi:TonB-dependent SusC/RagA subfamily outer membrane receptor